MNYMITRSGMSFFLRISNISRIFRCHRFYYWVNYNLKFKLLTWNNRTILTKATIRPTWRSASRKQFVTWLNCTNGTLANVRACLSFRGKVRHSIIRRGELIGDRICGAPSPRSAQLLTKLEDPLRANKFVKMPVDAWKYSIGNWISPHEIGEQLIHVTTNLPARQFLAIVKYFPFTLR